jgi:hypothetical protein
VSYNIAHVRGLLLWTNVEKLKHKQLINCSKNILELYLLKILFNKSQDKLDKMKNSL